MKSKLILLSVFLLATQLGRTVGAATPIYATDFEAGAGPEWSNTGVDSSQAGFTAFSGRFANSAQTLTLNGLVAGTSYTARFDLYIIDSWDGTAHNDSVQVDADGTTIFNYNFSNYNGNPPSNPQTYPAQPDVNRVQIGFHGSYVDSIYRSIEVTFTPAAATAALTFRGANLQDIGDESWGIDNVRIYASADIADTTIDATSLAAAGSTSTRAWDSFTVTASRFLQAASANSAANYSLRAAGGNGTFGDGDDVIWALTPSLSGRTVTLEIGGGPLQPGSYRFQMTGVLDANGQAVTPFSRDFSVAHPVLGRIENTSNGTLQEATVLPVEESPASSGLLTAVGVGTFNATNEEDFWRFEAENGDRITIRLDSEIPGVRPRIQVQNAAGGQVVGETGGNDFAFVQSHAITAPGAYYIRVRGVNGRSHYMMRLQQTRTLQQESEANDTAPGNPLNLTFTAGNYIARVTGAIDATDTAGDFFRIGVLNIGNSGNVNLAFPSGASIGASDVTMGVYAMGNATPVATSTTGSMNFSATADGEHYVMLTSNTRNVRAQYVLTFTATDAISPVITATTLPDEGTTVSTIINGFGLTLSEDLLASTVNNSASYDLRGSGPDAAFDTGDDLIYTVAAQNYVSGLAAAFAIPDGPLQPGAIRFTAKTALTDRSGNALGAAFVRSFFVGDVAGYVFEGRNNNTIEGATPLAAASGVFAGSFQRGPQTTISASNPHFSVTADFNNDNKPDLATFNWSSHNVSVLLGNGAGGLANGVTFAVQNNPIAGAAGDLNGDGNADIVAANYHATSVSILMGNGDGTFQPAIHRGVGSNPRSIAIADFNADGRMDIAVANSGSHNMSVLFRAEDGTYAAPLTLAAGSSPWGIGAGDVNGDGRPDVVTANTGADTVGVFLNNGDGTFQAVVPYAVGNGPRSLVIGQFNNQGGLDIVTMNANNNTFSFLAGTGDGTFAAAATVAAGTSDPYHIGAADFDTDGNLDFVIASYGQNRVRFYQGNGDGTFRQGQVVEYGGNPISIAIADFNADGIPDVGTSLWSNSTGGILLGHSTLPLAEDPAGSTVRTVAFRGSVANSEDLDRYAFSGSAGDAVIINIETPGNATGSQLRVELLDANSDIVLGFTSANNGSGQSGAYYLPNTARYFVSVRQSDPYYNEYRVRVTLGGSPIQVESEANNAIAQANRPTLARSGATQAATVLGAIPVADTTGDYYTFGELAFGTEIRLTTTQPSTSGFVPLLEILNAAGTAVATGASGAATLSYTLPEGGGGVYFGRVRTDGTGSANHQYILAVRLEDTLAPAVTAVSLPAEGSAVGYVYPYFEIRFNEDMTASTVQNASNYDLRATGPDGQFDTADDDIYGLSNSGYVSGLVASYFIPNGPLQPGSYRFTVTTGLQDRFGFPLGQPHVRLFTVTADPTAVLESRNNGSIQTATPLGGVGTVADGSFLVAAPFQSVHPNPWAMANGDVNGDGKLDLIVCNYSHASASVWLGNGDGTFTVNNTFAVGGQPYGARLVDVNGDGKLDFILAEYGPNTVGIHLGNGDGTFVRSTKAVGSNPRNVVVADLNGDGFLDLATANTSVANISVLLGAGDGTFANAVNHPAGGGQYNLEAGDLNGDGRPELVLALHDAQLTAVLRNNGDGTFAAPVTYSTPPNPRALALAELNGDSHSDLIVVTAQNVVYTFLGAGDATFTAAFNRPTGSSDPYRVYTHDFNLDGRVDIAVGGNGRICILNGLGNGDFGPVASYEAPGGPYNLAIGDYNSDGITDIAWGGYNSQNLGVAFGRAVINAVEDPAGSGFRTFVGRGNIDNTSDWDFFSFTANVGDTIVVASEMPTFDTGIGLHYRIENQTGDQIQNFSADSRGWGQSPPVTVGTQGTYFIRVSHNHQHWGEYRFRVSIAPPGMQIETENNQELNQANPVNMTLSNGLRRGSIAGYQSWGDGVDTFGLGNLSSGAAIRVDVRKPSTSSLAELVEILDASGARRAVSAAGDGTAAFDVENGQGGAYYVRLHSVGPSRTGDAGPYPYFNGANQFVNTGTWAPDKTYTIQAWTRPVTLPGGRRVIVGSLSSNQDWALVQINNELGLVYRAPNNSIAYLTTGRWPTLDKWVHLAGVCDGENVFLYVDGELAGTAPVAASYAPTTAGARIGGSVFGEYYYGYIDDVQVWDRALTQGEIQGYMNSVLTGAEPDLMGYWRFEEGTGTAISDSSAAARNGTLNVDAPWTELGPETATGRNLMAQYIVDVQVGDTSPPQITSVNLPEENSVNTMPYQWFSIGFSEDMLASSVNDVSNYQLVNLGPNNEPGGGDDTVYAVAMNGAYATGLTANYRIVNPPLQPGLYRFTISTGIRDRAESPLPQPYVRNFSVAGVPGFQLEDSDNNSFAAGDNLAGGSSEATEGTIVAGPNSATTGNNPWSIAAANLNGDTALDVVVANYSTAHVSVLLGNGDGTWRAPANYGVGNNPITVATGDFNSDGYTDIVSGNHNHNNVSVLLGVGDGTFGAATHYAAQGNPRIVVTGDFNGDGKLDIACGNQGSDTVSIFLNNGAGAFSAAANYAAGDGPHGMAVADFNRDGHQDLVVALAHSHQIAILFNDGVGAFAEPVLHATASTPRSVAAGDLDADQWPDIVTVDAGNNVVSLFKNRNGIFQLARQQGAWTSDPYHITIADMNADSRPDLVIANYGWSRVNILQGLGGMSFADASRFIVPGRPIYVAPGDFNGDGRMDVATANYETHTVGLALGVGSYPLPETPDGLRHAWGRGNNSDGNDRDHFFFSARQGDRIEIATENPGNPANSGLRFELLRYEGGEDGERYVDFYPDNRGFGQTTAILTAGGTYFLRVSRWHEYYGEYRFRVTLAPAPAQFETEGNDSIGSADVVAFQNPNAGRSTANVLASLRPLGDSDFFYLGNFGPGQRVEVSTERGARATLWPVLAIVNQAGAVLVDSSADAPSVTLTTESSLPLYIRASRDGVGGIDETYELNITVTDNIGPSVTGIGLPNAGQATGGVIDRFGISFSEDMNASTVRAAGAFDLRATGPDNAFDTADDEVYGVANSDYTTGLNATLYVTDGPLQAGTYRFRANTTLADTSGRAMSAVFDREFAVNSRAPYQIEDRDNNSIPTATALAFTADPVGLHTAFARGNLRDRADHDFYRFTATAGQRMTLNVDVPGNPGGTQLYWRLFNEAGAQIWEFHSDYYGYGQTGPYTIPADGNYYVVARYWYDYYGEYNLRVNLTDPPMLIETEANDAINSANALTLVENGSTRSGSVAGYTRLNGDLDYFRLEGIPGGSTVFLVSRLPATSSLTPTVALYNAASGYMPEAGAGRPFDGVAEVRIPQDAGGNYFALVRNSETGAGLQHQYALEVQVAPTDQVAFPNLQVTTVNAPTGANIVSGQSVTINFTVQNVGSEPTPTGAWSDQVIISGNAILGDGDDLPLGLISHNGVLAPGASYEVNQPMTLPEGISGNFYVIVRTDALGAVGEFVLEGDNTTASASTFAVTRAAYPDIVVENLTVSAPENDVFTISWLVANRGNLAAGAGFGERVIVRNVGTGQTLLNVEENIATALDPGQTLNRLRAVTVTAAGQYQVLVTEDTRNQLFEFDANSHASAEQNTFQTTFQILPRYTIAVSANPGAGGTVTGGGTFLSGASVTVRAVADTSALPYQFLNWTEGGVFQSSNAEYTFTADRNRSLVANFTLPTFTIAASSNPAGGGAITGAGPKPYGSTVTLTATPRFGYNFQNWTEGNTVLGTSPTLTFQALANRTITANFSDAHPTHVVTTATFPAGIATVSGAGTYNNGQTVTFIAPARVVQDQTVYIFKRFTIGGVEVSTSASYQKTFATTDAPALEVVAEYDSRSLYPLVTRTITSFNSPIPRTTQLFVTLQFNRSMNPARPLQLAFRRTSGAGLVPIIPDGGTWSRTVSDNDTYRTPAITVGDGMDAEVDLMVSGGEDLEAAAVQLAAVARVVLDATLPQISNVANTPGSASVIVTWQTDENATSQVEYGLTASFGRNSPLSAALVTSHRVQVTGLTPDTEYHFRVRSRDRAGNERVSAAGTFRTLQAPDLVVESIVVDEPQGGLRSGSTVGIRWTVRNTGVGPTSGAWFEHLQVVNRSTGQQLLEVQPRYDAAALQDVLPTQTREFTAQLTLPDGAPGIGQIAFIARTDAFNNQAEDNAASNAEANNTREIVVASTVREYPDLQIRNLAITPNAPVSGGEITLAWEDLNSGNAPVAAPYRNRVVIRNQNTGQTLIDTQLNVNAGATPIAPAGAAPRSFVFRLPDGEPGVGRITANLSADVGLAIFEYNVANTGEQNNGASAQVTSTLASYPDLTIVGITAPTEATAGSEIDVAVTLRNRGTAPTSGPWNDQLFISEDNSIGSDGFLGTFAFADTIGAGAEVTVTRRVRLPQFGTGNRWIVARTDVSNQLFESDEGNNVAIDDRAVNLPSNLFISIGASAISEAAGANAAFGTVTRNSGTAVALEVTLASSDVTEATVPQTITIPAGQTSIAFPINAVNDADFDGTQNVTITASAAGFSNVSTGIAVHDDDRQTVAVLIAVASVREDAGALPALLRRNSDPAAPLTVNLTSSDPLRLSAPGSVTIPAGAAEIAFNLAVNNNTAPNRPLNVTISPSVTGFQGTSDSVELLDDDLPGLSLTLSEASVSEGASNPAAEGVVGRGGSTAAALQVLLSSDNTSALRTPISVIIPAGASTATFPITVVNNNLVDGTRRPTITAFTADAVFGTAITEGSAQAQMDVTDDDGPTLTVSVDSELLAESGTIVGRVFRNTQPTGPLTVSLLSSDTTEATVPPTIVIPTGETTVTFAITGVSDGQADGIQRAAVTGSAGGYNSGSASFSVSDIDLPDLRVMSITGPSTARTLESVDVTFVVSNDGLSTANPNWVDFVYLATTPDGGGLVRVGTPPRAQAVNVGESYSRTISVPLPANPGRYYLMVVADAQNRLTEGSKRNNTLISSTPIVVAPVYHATVSTEIETVGMNTPVPYAGRAFRTDNNAAMPNVDVLVRVNIRGTRRTFTARTDEAGNFAGTFTPLPGEAGRAIIGADHPGVPEDPEQDAFSIYGMRFNPGNLAFRMFPVSDLTGEIELRNLGDLPLTELTQSTLGLPPEVTMTLTLPETIEPEETVTVPYRLVVGNFTSEVRIRGGINAQSAENAQALFTFDLIVAPHRPTLTVTPGFLEVGMLRGRQRTVEFDLANVGGAGTGELEIQLPQGTSWLSLATPDRLPSLAPGQTSRVVLNLTPPADLPLNRYTGNLVVISTSGAGVNVPFSFLAQSELRGDYRVKVVDDVTAQSLTGNGLPGASVVFVNPLTGGTVANGTTDATGVVTFTDLQEGSYQMTVSAPGHGQARDRVDVVPGRMSFKEVFIDLQTVTYRWTVVPIEIEDRYRIVLEADFETEVPVPVVTIDNPLIMPLVVEGMDTQFEVRLTNHGLVQAEHVQLEIPFHPDYIIEPLITELDVLPARSSLAIPARIRARPETQPVSWSMVRERALGNVAQSAARPTGCGIFPKIRAKWNFQAGQYTRWHYADATVIPVYVDTECWAQIQGYLPENERARPKDLLGDWEFYLCELVGVIAECTDTCTATIVRAACGVAGGGNINNVLAAANEWSRCWCPPTPGGSGGGGGGGGGGGFGVIGGGGGGFSGSPGNPVGAPIHWDYSAPCNPTVHGDAGICARVRLQIVQEAVITRAAFLGTLELDNGDTQNALTGIQVTLDIRDERDQPAGERFAIAPPVLNGITGVDGSGRLVAGGSGTVAYTIIPNRMAAPEAPTVYRIGGTLVYYIGDSRLEVPLLADTITVYPDPILHLTYFWQRDVYSDDPFTPDVVEPAEPFSLGLLVKNTGHGAALNFRIISGQPEIIENEKGLLIDFRIIGTQAGEEQVQPTLEANLGRIEPGATRAAAWSIVSTLQGKFMNYTANFEHITSLGDPQLSLIESVTIHELIHQFQSQAPNADRQPDFLANDEADPQSLPDTVWLSDGTAAPVQLATNAQADGTASLGDLQVVVTADMTSGWNYVKIPNPGVGLKLWKVVRSDGLQLLVPQNAWTTDRTFPNAQAGAIREHFFHLIDFNGTGSYTLFFRPDDSVAPQVLEILDIAPIQTSALGAVSVVFSEEIDLATFDAADVTLSLNDGANLINVPLTIERVQGSVYRISGLAPLNATEGNYRITVNGAGIQDFGGNDGTGTATATWSRVGLAPLVTAIQNVGQLRRLPVPSLEVTFSKAINVATFTTEDISLTLNGEQNLINGNVTIAQISPNIFRVDGLGSLTADNGEYRFTVSATGVQDTLGNAGTGQLSRTWTQDVVQPRVIHIDEIATNPRNIVVPFIDVEFSEAINVSSFTRADLILRRNGGNNLIDDRVVITQLSPVRFRISEFTWVSGAEGTYEFIVDSEAIFDLAGNGGVQGGVTSWVMDTTQPPTPTSVRIDPDNGISTIDFITSANQLTVFGSLGEDNLRVRFYHLETQTDLGFATVTGRDFAKALTLTPGAHHIRVTAIDQAGNASEPYRLEPFIDLVGPTASYVAIAPDPRDSNVPSLDITFGEDINPATFTREDLSLRVDGGANLINAGVGISSLGGRAYRINGLAPLTENGGLYEFSVNLAGITDTAGSPGIGLATETWRRIGANSAPILEQPELRITALGSRVLIQFTARDNDLPAQTLTFSSSQLPAGATLTPAGLFDWTPAAGNAGRNTIPITVTDNGSPALSTTVDLIVDVVDYAEVKLGRSIVLRGNTVRVPLEFFASANVGEFTFDLAIPGGESPDLRVDALVPNLRTLELTSQGAGLYRVRVQTTLGDYLNQRQNIAELVFTPPLNRPTSFIHLLASNFSATKADLTPVPQTGALRGRVVAIGDQPMLEALLDGTTRTLVLYGRPGKNYLIQNTGSFVLPFRNPITYLMDNALFKEFPVANSGSIYFRCSETAP